MVFRKLVHGAETEIELVVALRTHPLAENAAKGIGRRLKVDWDVPKSAPLSSVEAWVGETSRMESAKPTAVG